MSHLAEKSDSNLLCANLLYENGHFAASVHCSYYSLFQRMKSVVTNSLGISYIEYDRKQDLFSGSSHDFLLQFFCKEYLKKDNRTKRDKERFENEVRDLKALRIKADYKNIEIAPAQSLNAYKCSERMQKHIQNTFTSTT